MTSSELRYICVSVDPRGGSMEELPDLVMQGYIHREPAGKILRNRLRVVYRLRRMGKKIVAVYSRIRADALLLFGPAKRVRRYSSQGGNDEGPSEYERNDSQDEAPQR